MGGKGTGGTGAPPSTQVAQVVQQQQLVHWVLLGLVVQQQQLVHWVLLGLGVVQLEEAKEAEHHLLEQLETALQS